MSIFKAIRKGMQGGDGGGELAAASSSDASEPLLERYSRLNEEKAIADLHRLNQVELTAIETFERANRDREAVLNKLRYLRQTEPVPGYDELEPEAIAKALSGADTETVKAVRGYERKFRGRPAALEAVAGALHRARERPAVASDEAPAPVRADEQPLVVGNGIPVNTPRA